MSRNTKNKIVTLWAGDTAIHFIKRIKKSLQYIYVVEVENIGIDGIDFDMSKLTSPFGYNVLNYPSYELEINEDKLLTQGHIKVGGKRHKGIVAFIKNERATNAPIVFYNGYSVRVNFIERRNRLHGSV